MTGFNPLLQPHRKQRASGVNNKIPRSYQLKSCFKFLTPRQCLHQFVIEVRRERRSNMKLAIFLFVVLSIFHFGYGKIFTKCELAKALSETFPQDKLADWNCLVKHESSYNSMTRSPKNRNGSYDYGIFQINDKYWCKVGTPGGDCNIDCNSKLTQLNFELFLFSFIRSQNFSTMTSPTTLSALRRSSVVTASRLGTVGKITAEENPCQVSMTASPSNLFNERLNEFNVNCTSKRSRAMLFTKWTQSGDCNKNPEEMKSSCNLLRSARCSTVCIYRVPTIIILKLKELAKRSQMLLIFWPDSEPSSLMHDRA